MLALLRFNYNCLFYLICILLSQVSFAQVQHKSHIIKPALAEILKLNKGLQEKQLAKLLGWVAVPKNLCKGYYLTTPVQSMIGIKPGEIKLSAGDGVVLRLQGESHLSGGISIQRQGEELRANEARLWRNAEQKKIEKITLQNSVEYFQSNLSLYADLGELQLPSYALHLQPVAYHLTRSWQQKTQDIWGKASKLYSDPAGIMTFDNVSYSGCEVVNPAWVLHANSLMLDRKQGMGVLKNAKLTVKSVPIAYLPYLKFPIDDQRHSGFLFPLFGFSEAGGYYLGLPYYWNWLPNRDAKLTPFIYSKRGFGLDSNWRYLLPKASGNIQGFILPNDSAFHDFYKKLSGFYQLSNDDKSVAHIKNYRQTRWGIIWNNQWNPMLNLAVDLHAERVSDDYFTRDFSWPNRDNLPSSITLDYHNDYGYFQVKNILYQYLHPMDAASTNLPLYSLRPQITWEQSYSLAGISTNSAESLLSFASSYTNFYSPSVWWTDNHMQNGQRLHIQPKLSIPFQVNGVSVKTEIGAFMTQYWLPAYHATPSIDLHRILPNLSVEVAKANLSMLQIWNKQYLRDLQARMYYLYIPWRDQSAYPNFDTGYISSNQDFYFMDNRFKGIDRIGDANQIAIGMRSGFVEPNSGRLLADFGVNEMLALRKHRVCLLDSCLDDVNAFHHLSPMLLYASYHPVNALELGARARLNLPKKHVSHLDVSMGYGKDNEHAMVYFGLRRVANLSAIYYPISVVGSHIDWQLSSHWSMSSDLRYQKRPQSRLAYDIDLNYDSCCWAASLKLIQTDRSFTKLIRKYYRPDIRLSIQLKGLGSIASH